MHARPSERYHVILLVWLVLTGTPDLQVNHPSPATLRYLLPHPPARQAKKKKMIDLPTPITTAVLDYETFTRKNWSAPVAYIRRALPRDAAEDDAAPPEYDLEGEDEVRGGRGG